LQEADCLVRMLVAGCLIIITNHVSFVTVFMTLERWQQIDKVLVETLEWAPSQRSAFLEDACAVALEVLL